MLLLCIIIITKILTAGVLSRGTLMLLSLVFQFVAQSIMHVQGQLDSRVISCNSVQERH